jgi:FO synthase
MEALIRLLGRNPVQRTTLYQHAPPAAHARALNAAPLTPMVQTPLTRKRGRATALAD